MFKIELDTLSVDEYFVFDVTVHESIFIAFPRITIHIDCGPVVLDEELNDLFFVFRQFICKFGQFFFSKLADDPIEEFWIN